VFDEMLANCGWTLLDLFTLSLDDMNVLLFD
jgi:hypothetical protein